MPRGVSIVVLDRTGVLLVRRAKPPFHGIWSFPGGALEPREAPEAAVRRELLEETGLTAGSITEIGRFRVRPTRDTYDLTVFAARFPGGAPVAASDAAEARMVPFERILTLDLTPGAPGWIATAVERLMMQEMA